MCAGRGMADPGTWLHGDAQGAAAAAWTKGLWKVSTGRMDSSPAPNGSKPEAVASFPARAKGVQDLLGTVQVTPFGQ
jgi:hypothetical protein